MSQCAKLHVAGWKCAVFTRVYLESCMWPLAIFTMDPRKEQRVYIKFYASLGKSATENLTVIQQAFRDQSLSRARVFQWPARFKTGHMSFDDDKHTGRPTSCTTPETVTQIQELVHQDWCRTIHDMLRRWELVMGHANGFCRKNWAWTVSQPSFCPGSWRRPKLWREQTWLLHHDNAPSHTSVLTQQFLAKNKIPVIPHPPYSPDLAPCEFFLFLSRIHRENRHRSRTRLQTNACKNCALPSSYVQLGTLTHYTWESYRLPAIPATTTAVEVAAPVSKILDTTLYICSPCHLIDTSNLYRINRLLLLNAEYLPSILLLYKTLTVRDQVSHPLKRANYIVLIGASSPNKQPTVVRYLSRS
jgi:hypothetical protein